MKNKRCLMVFEINQEDRTQIKILAAKRNITMREWVGRALKEYIEKECKPAK